MNRPLHNIAIAVAALAAASVALTGCDAAKPSTDDASGNIGFSFWGSPQRAEKVSAVIDLFEAKYPDISVRPDVSEYNAYVERLTVRAAGEGLSCVVGMQSYFANQYAEKGVLAPLDDFIESGAIDVSGIPEDVLEAGQIDGVQYVIPTGAIVRLFAYNTSLVEQSGAGLPVEGMTWSEYADWLRKVQAGLPDGVHAAEIEGHYLPTLTSWVLAHGQQMFKDGKLAFDRELLAKWFEYWLKLEQEGVTISPSELAAQTGSLELSPFGTAGTATAGRDIPQLAVTEGILQAAGHDTTVGYMSMPTESSDRPADFLGVNGIAITESCDRPAAAAAFVDFFTNDADAGVAFQSDNGVVTSKAQQEALVADADTPGGVKRNIEVMQELTESGAVTTTEYPSGIASLRAELVRIYEQVAFGGMSVEEGVDTFFTTAESALK